MVFHSLTQSFNHDEEVYVTAAYLAQHMRLYADFLYLQTPIYPLVLSKLLMLFSSVSPFLIARLLSAALAIGSVVVFFGLAARLSKSERVRRHTRLPIRVRALDAAGLWFGAQ